MLHRLFRAEALSVSRNPLAMATALTRCFGGDAYMDSIIPDSIVVSSSAVDSTDPYMDSITDFIRDSIVDSSAEGGGRAIANPRRAAHPRAASQ